MDCPGYELPDNFDSLGAAELLETAVIQIEENRGYILKVDAPGGGFFFLATTRQPAYGAELDCSELGV